MATGWRKSLHCRNNAVDDVVRPLTLSSSSPSSTKKQLLSCRNTTDAAKDVFLLFPKCPSSSCSLQKKPKPRPEEPPASPAPGVRVVGITRSDPFPVLAALPPGHSSRRVVEIIFSSSWSSSGGRADAAGFPGKIEMLFRVHSPAREVARFEEHRAAVRARSGGEARCAADGNEMMCFHSAAAGSGVYDAGVARSFAWCSGRKVEGVRTFTSSGGAHASGGGGRGRRAMLVCRVIAGRVRGESDPGNTPAESVSLTEGELVVLDSRAVMPCFLIIYSI